MDGTDGSHHTIVIGLMIVTEESVLLLVIDGRVPLTMARTRRNGGIETGRKRKSLRGWKHTYPLPAGVAFSEVKA